MHWLNLILDSLYLFVYRILYPSIGYLHCLLLHQNQYTSCVQTYLKIKGRLSTQDRQLGVLYIEMSHYYVHSLASNTAYMYMHLYLYIYIYIYIYAFVQILMHTNAEYINKCTYLECKTCKERREGTRRKVFSYHTSAHHVNLTCAVSHICTCRHTYLQCLHLILTEFPFLQRFAFFCNSHLLATYAHVPVEV